MLTKAITYTDFLDEERTDNFYFNISKAEMTDMQLGTAGTMSANLQKIIDSKDNRQIIDTFKYFIKASYGVRSPDGRQFVKSEENWAAFQGCGAYDALFLLFFDDADIAAAFINGIMPADLVAEAQTVPTTNGFRPGAETLPQSRRDALAAENVPQPSDEQIAIKERYAAMAAEADRSEENALQMNNSSGYQERADAERAAMRAEIEAEIAAQNNATPWNGTDGLPQQ